MTRVMKWQESRAKESRETKVLGNFAELRNGNFVML